jgi:purine nucleosidase
MTRTRVIIDCDPGVDDCVAILIALASPELDVVGVSAVAGNVPLAATLTNACKIVALSGRLDVPVRAGAAAPLVRDQVFGKHVAVGAFVDELVPTGNVRPDAEDAVAFLVRTAREAAAEGRPLTICASGPLTNIALALVQHPDVARGIGRIVCMGGAFTALGYRTPWAEFNIYADPHAAEMVFSSGIAMTLLPLDVTLQALFTVEHVARMRAQGAAAGAAIANLMTAFDRSDMARFGRPGGPIHDATTIAWLLEPRLFSGKRGSVGVEVAGRTQGHTYVDFSGGTGGRASIDVMTALDAPGFIDLVLDRIARYGADGPGISAPRDQDEEKWPATC